MLHYPWSRGEKRVVKQVNHRDSVIVSEHEQDEEDRSASGGS